MQAVSSTLVLLVLLGATLAWAEEQPQGLPEGPSWGRGRFQPTKANVAFATADGCALCHSAAPEATALRDATGADVSPHGLWQASVMANAFRDPYWRAQVAHEIAAAPEQSAEIQALCLRCHGPMASHTARLSGEPSPTIAQAAKDPFAVDGVSCTVCHQVPAEGLGTPERLDGHLDIRPERKIYGPYASPVEGPMRAHSAFRPTHGAHIQESAHCASCHTLTTSPGEGHPGFVEQAPYFEWRNSVYTTEGDHVDTSAAKSCQDCHMTELGSMRIARNPVGRDFFMDERPDVRGHTFVGGNTHLLRILAANREALDVPASEAALERMIFATRRFLKEETASLTISDVTRKEGRLHFSIRVENRSGHKLPTGYPARRVWLEVQVRDGRRTIWSSGRADAAGRIEGLQTPRSLEHVRRVRTTKDVPVWEAVPVDLAGKPTTLLHAMARMGKDNRLLPRGWRADGPHAAQTAPVGTAGDADFVAGSDTVAYEVPLPMGASQGLRVVAFLRYQSIPPAWVEPLHKVEDAAAKRFLEMVEKTPATPETLAIQVQREAP